MNIRLLSLLRADLVSLAVPLLLLNGCGGGSASTPSPAATGYTVKAEALSPAIVTAGPIEMDDPPKMFTLPPTLALLN